jgi:hypothetical protein
VFGVLEQKYASLGASGSRPSSVLFRYRLNRYHDGRRTAPPGTGLRLVLHRPHQYVRVPYCSMHVLVESLPESNLQIFNPAATVGNEQLEFPLFRFFPVEIRRKIWQHSLQRHRYIHIRLQPRIDQPDFEERRLYCIVACGYQLLSKLFRVNRESRDVAVHFYRVNLPCEFSKAETLHETTKHGTLHLNPEYDILQVSPLWGVKNIVIDFLYHLKATHDPLHIGTRNLAMELNDLNGNDLHQIRASDLDPQ